MEADKKLIDKVVKDLDKKFEGHIKTLEAKKDENAGVLGFVPSNNLAIDYVIGRRGIPIGRITELYGKSGAGKSSIVASLIGAAQKAGIISILIDAENSYDPSWARRFHVNTDELMVLEPDSLEDSFDMTRAVIEGFREADSTAPIFVAYDSVSALPTVAETEKEDSSGSSASAGHARIISEQLRRITGLVKNQTVSLLFVSQLKDNPRATWGDAESILGGSAIKFHAALRLKVTKMKTLKEKDKAVGITIQITAVKNKFTIPYKVHTFDLYYESGFKEKEILLDFLTEDYINIIPEKQGWYDWEGVKLRKEQIVEKLDDTMLEMVYEKLGIPQ